MSRPEVPPYARIVAELRARIAGGELAAGDRIPSAREIARTRGVALATATRVLAALRQEGLVRAVTGIGTVVVGDGVPAPAPAPVREAVPRRAADSGLTPERVVAAAVAIADREGIAAVSMRRLAADLDTAAMSLYRHVTDKDDLRRQMADAVLREWALPADPPDGWRARVEIAARTLWSAFRRHPWLASVLSLTRPQPIAAGMAYTEWMLEALDGHGLDLPAMLGTHLALLNYVRGTAMNLEFEADAEASTGLTVEGWREAAQPELRAVLAGGRFPLLERATLMEHRLDVDALFERGLRHLLDGLAVTLEG
jgi:AcrR family transcriptional regulator